MNHDGVTNPNSDLGHIFLRKDTLKTISQRMEAAIFGAERMSNRKERDSTRREQMEVK